MTLSLTTGVRLVVATHNAGKAVEIAALLDDRYETVTAGVLGLPEPEETVRHFALTPPAASARSRCNTLH